MNTHPRIALISAVPAAIAPAVEAIGRRFPDAEAWNLLDDRLLSDADDAGGLNDALRARMERLIEHAVTEGAAGVLLTCSLYGSVAQDTMSDVPVLAADEAAFADIAAGGYNTVLVVASFAAARDDSVTRLQDALGLAGSRTSVVGVAVPAALTATKTGDHRALLAALCDGVAEIRQSYDAVFLAQYSLAPAGGELAAALGVPVISGPDSSADALRDAIRTGARP